MTVLPELCKSASSWSSSASASASQAGLHGTDWVTTRSSTFALQELGSAADAEYDINQNPGALSVFGGSSAAEADALAALDA